MATISSTGIGSGLDVNSIVSQLVALEKAPLKSLTIKATNVQSQISAFGQIQSQFSALSDVATRISDPTTWSARGASSSNTAAASITATSAAQATSFSLDVDALAQQQSIASAANPAGTVPGAGTLTFQLGKWTAAALPTDPPNFAPGTASGVDVVVLATDTIAAIADKINKTAGVGVVASVFNDGTNERLLLRSKDSGEAAGFRVRVAESGTSPTNNDNTGLSSLAFDSAPSVPAVPDTGGALIASGMGTAGIPVQYGQDAKARINGLAVTSTTNTLTGNILGVTINLVNTTTTGYGTAGELKAPVSMSINEDVTPGVKNVQDFVTAYNALNSSLSDLIKYDPATKTAGLFQGDATIVGMQHLLRSMLGSASLGAASQHLADVGVLAARDGSLSIDTAKLSAAANNGTSLQQLFTNNNKNPLTNGFALKFRDLAKGVLATGGAVVNEAAALQRNLARNTAEQTKVTDRATLVEARLRAQYSALDTKMASLNSLSAYVSQQVTTWNKSTA